MSSRLIKNTKRRPAICKEIASVSSRVQWKGSVWVKENWFSLDDLHYWIVVEFPLVSRQDWSSIDVDGSSPLIGNEKVSVILQFDDSYWQKHKNSKFGKVFEKVAINIFLSGWHCFRQRLYTVYSRCSNYQIVYSKLKAYRKDDFPSFF